MKVKGYQLLSIIGILSITSTYVNGLMKNK